MERKGGVDLATRHIKNLLADESGLVSTLELTIGVILSFTLIVTAVILIAYSIMGVMVDDAALVSARAGAQYFFPVQSAQAVTTAQEVFAKAIPQSKQVACSSLNVTTPVSEGQSFTVSSRCSVNMGTFLGVHIGTTWTAQASMPIGPYSVTN